jgi:peptide/nickel transport system substrate-binding protein
MRFSLSLCAQRRLALACALGASTLALVPVTAQAQSSKTTAVVGMMLEPQGLDPTVAPSASIGEIVHLNVLEGLTKINVDGHISPLLAERWRMEPDGKSYTFTLRKGVKFHDGEAFDADDVKFTFERAKAEGSTNKAKKVLFDNISKITTLASHTVIFTLNKPDGNFLFRLGENPAVILDAKSAAGTAQRPVGTGPFKFDDWKKGNAVVLSRFDGYRTASAVKLKKVTFRFITDPAAQVAALLAGDVDGFPRGLTDQSLKQFQSDARFSVTPGSTAGKGIMAINNKRKPFDDVRVRRALAHAIDRKAFIDGVLDGKAVPIGSHFVPTDAGYVDLTGVTPYDPDKARALLKEAGVQTPLKVTLTLPPPQYARQGGEVLAAQLAKVGIQAKIENVEWAQWLSEAFKGQFDLTLINHVEPLDYMIYTDSQYYYGYDSKAFRELAAKHAASTSAKERNGLFAQMQKQLATDAVNVYIFNPQQAAVAKKGLKGLWHNSPIFANDMAAVSWQ